LNFAADEEGHDHSNRELGLVSKSISSLVGRVKNEGVAKPNTANVARSTQFLTGRQKKAIFLLVIQCGPSPSTDGPEFQALPPPYLEAKVEFLNRAAFSHQLRFSQKIPWFCPDES
jgi:hypothetical protein